MTYFKTEMTIDGHRQYAEMIGFSARSIRIRVSGRVAYMRKQLFDIWMMHPELNFHMEKATIPGDQELLFLN